MAAILIAGPTASGKSALAMDLAARVNGTLVNADAMQIYRDLRVLTARPTPEDEARVPHALYGTLDAAERASAGLYGQLAQTQLATIVHDGRMPIFVGGTGLYFRVLTEGIAPVPPVPDWAREEAEAMHARTGGEGMLRALRARDAASVAGLRASDPQRLKRAWAVFAATGKSLAHWQRQAAPPVLQGRFLKLALWPDRAALTARIETRVEWMVRTGGLEEVAALRERGLDPSLPAMKAIGVPELMAHLAGQVSLAEATEHMAIQTRRYAKRQLTWIRTQMADWHRVEPGDWERFLAKEAHLRP